MAQPALTIDQHVSAVRRNPKDGRAALVAALQDPDFKRQAMERLAALGEMERAGRLDACWISQQTKTTLTAALAAANTPKPGVLAGAKNE